MALTRKKLREIERNVGGAWAEIDTQARAHLPQPGERTIKDLEREWGFKPTKARKIARQMIAAGTMTSRRVGSSGQWFFMPVVKKGKK